MSQYRQIRKPLKDVAAGQDYEHVGYLVLYATNKVQAMQSDEEIEKAGEYIKQAIETGSGLELAENQYILETIAKLKEQHHFNEMYPETDVTELKSAQSLKQALVQNVSTESNAEIAKKLCSL
jgi:Fic family protein